MKKENYVVVNIWPAESNAAFDGHNVGHVSLQTSDAYYSLWPAMRTIVNQILDKSNQKVYVGCKPGIFEFRKREFKVDYIIDAATEGIGEQDYGYNKIESLNQLKLGQVAVVKNRRLGTFKRAFTQQDIDVAAGDELLAVNPLYAAVRVILFGLDIDKIATCFAEMHVYGWGKLGSNTLTRYFSHDRVESCASLAMQLLDAGGLYKNLSSIRSVDTSSYTRVEHVLKHVMAVKKLELQEYPETRNWQVDGVTQTSLERLASAYANVGERQHDFTFKQEDGAGCSIL